MLHLPSPQSLGFDRFPRYRPQQVGAIYDITGSARRFRIVNAPTGIGKTLIAMSIGVLEDARILFITSTKALQDLYEGDGRSAGMVDIRGASNYRCPALERGGSYAHLRGEGPAMADRGPCLSGMPCRLRESGCPKFDALAAARASRMVVTNYDYWLSNLPGPNGEGLGDFDIIVFDELHTAVDHLSKSLHTELDATSLATHLHAAPLPPSSSIGEWRRWGREMQLRTAAMLDALSAELRYARERGEIERAAIDEVNAIRALDRVLLAIGSMEGEWIAETHRSGVTSFDPVWVDRYAERYLFRGIPVVVGMSATVRSRIVHYLGIEEGAFDFLEYDSPFNPRLGPVYRWPLVRMNYSMSDSDKRKWARGIDRLIDDRMDRRSLVHTVSYKRAREYRQLSHLPDDVLITHDPRTVRPAVERYLRQLPSALASPAVGTGWDFAYDACELNVISKVPYPPTDSPIMQARMKSDRSYASNYARDQIMQYAGRAVRAVDDQAETVIVDSAFEGLTRGDRNGPAFARWFVRRLQWVDGPPRPMRKLMRKSS